MDLLLSNATQAVRAVQAALIDVPDEFQLSRVKCSSRTANFSCQANEVPATNRINLVVVDLGGGCISAGTGAIAQVCFTDRLPQCPAGRVVALTIDPSSVQIASCSGPGCTASLFGGGVTCGVLGDCNVDGSFNLFDILTNIDIVLGRVTPTAVQQKLCDDTCDGVVNIFDILREIDGVLGRIPTPLTCPATAAAGESGGALAPSSAPQRASLARHEVTPSAFPPNFR